MQCRPQGPPGRLGCKVGGQGGQGLGIVAGVVGELHRDGLRGSLGDRSIELLDGPLGLDSLIEADEANSLGEARNC